MALEVPVLYRRSRLLADGLTQLELQRMLERGNLTPVRRGAYIAARIPDRATMHRLQVMAAMHDLAGGTVPSHVSAAVLHGLPTWGMPTDRLTVTKARRSGGRVSRRLHSYTASLAPEEIVSVDGVPVTTVARTIVDLARTVSFESSVVAADAALARCLVTDEELAAALIRATGWPGVPRARRVVAFADGRAESVGESRSRVAIFRAGLPTPVPQWEVRDVDGRLVGRVDFGWPELHLVGEFDGRVKYGRLLRPGQTSADAVFEEKIREDAVRAEQLTVVRWTWDEIPTFTAKLRRALEAR
jgi:hypothetical protein